MNYNSDIVKAYFKECGLPEPVFEFKFHPTRRWRFDLAYPESKLYIEVQGALFTGGRHTRGAALVKEYEKINNATILGWRGLFVLPNEICMMETVEMIREALI